MTYDIGDEVRIEAIFRDLENTLTDPTTVTLSIRKPGLPMLVYSYPLSPIDLIRVSAGKYRLDIVMDVPGTWKYKWTGAGALNAVEEARLFVRPPNVP